MVQKCRCTNVQFIISRISTGNPLKRSVNKFLDQEKGMHIYHIVKDTIRNPLNTVSSKIGARTPVMPSRQAVL